jgi:hypothetical protein
MCSFLYGIPPTSYQARQYRTLQYPRYLYETEAEAEAEAEAKKKKDTTTL